jgi:hypothetical protein
MPEFPKDPVTTAVEKLTPDGTALVMGVGGWLSNVFGNVPSDLVGYFGGDKLRAWRLMNILKLEQEVMHYQALLSDVVQTKPIAPKILLPALEAASLEDSDFLKDLWARLLAAASSPSTDFDLTNIHIETMKSFSPQEALLFTILFGETFKSKDPNFGFSWANLSSQDEMNALAQRAGIPESRFRLALDNLDRLGILKAEPNSNPNGLTVSPTHYGIDFYVAAACFGN